MIIDVSMVAAVATELFTLVGILSPVILSMKKLKEGTKCQLRSEILRIYYHNREGKCIRQYEYENFVMLYEAYKALKGNSFIDKICEEVKNWEVIT